MADALPTWMASAIASYDGPVTVCPPCTFSDVAQFDFRRALAADYARGKRAKAARQRGRGEEISERRDRIAAMALDGKSGREICAAVGISHDLLEKDLRQIRKARPEVTIARKPKAPPARAKREPKPKMPGSPRRVSRNPMGRPLGTRSLRIIDLVREGRTIREIAASVDAPPKQVRTIISRLRKRGYVPITKSGSRDDG